jgi:hypothetical protein
MITGGRLPVEEFELGWAVLVGRGFNGESPRPTFPQRAHFYDARDLNALRAICGNHLVAITDAIAFDPGNWLRCQHCQRIFDRRWQ